MHQYRKRYFLLLFRMNYETGKFNIYAPYGLNDLFRNIVRLNKLLAAKEHFEEKSKKWKSKRDDTTSIEW